MSLQTPVFPPNLKILAENVPFFQIPDILNSGAPFLSEIYNNDPYLFYFRVSGPGFTPLISHIYFYSSSIFIDVHSPIPHSRHVGFAQATYSLYYIQFFVLHKYFILKFHCLSSSSTHKSYINKHIFST